jgi:hypothetical protein
MTTTNLEGMAMTYVHLSDQSVKMAMASLGNRKVVIAEPKLVSKTCWRCSFNEIAPDRERCPRCAADLVNPLAQHDKIEQERKDYAALQKKMEQIEDISGKMLQFMQVVKKKDPKLYGEFETIVADG